MRGGRGEEAGVMVFEVSALGAALWCAVIDLVR